MIIISPPPSPKTLPSSPINRLPSINPVTSSFQLINDVKLDSLGNSFFRYLCRRPPPINRTDMDETLCSKKSYKNKAYFGRQQMAPLSTDLPRARVSHPSSCLLRETVINGSNPRLGHKKDKPDTKTIKRNNKKKTKKKKKTQKNPRNK